MSYLKAITKLAFALPISALLLIASISFAHVASQEISVQVGPDHVQQVSPGQIIVYDHVLTNTGISTETFSVEVLSTQRWPVGLLGKADSTGTLLLPITVGSQMTVSFQVNLTVPFGVAGVTEITLVTATSQISPTVLDTTTDTSIVMSRIYLPLVSRRWPPVPYPPLLNAIQGADDGEYAISWVELPSRLADTYTLQEAADSAFATQLREVCTTAQQSCSLSGQRGGTYYYRVRGTNFWGYGPWSSVQFASVLSQPLLTTKWGQTDNFARFSPDNWRLGCWSTAIAQILYFHRLRPSGSASYQTTTGYAINENLDSYTFDWDLFVDEFNGNTPEASINQVAKYAYFTSIVIQKDFGTDEYVLNAYQRAAAIANHYHCNSQVFSTPGYSIQQTKQIIMQELDARRPIMLHLRNLARTTSHAIVVDAYRVKNGEFWVHINMGHEGNQDGWYNYETTITYYDDNSYRRLLTISP